MEKNYLSCIYDNAKSFYKKAEILGNNGILALKSYDTIVLLYDVENEKVLINGTHSNTTLRHIKEFLRQRNFKAITKKQIEKDYFNYIEYLNLYGIFLGDEFKKTSKEIKKFINENLEF